jgi:manganese/zinc/iron transport system substrate-binding protein
MKLFGLIVTLFGLAAAVGCDRDGAAGPSGSGTGKLNVVATTTMIGDLVAAIGGDDIALRVIIGPGVDPHTFKPSPADVAHLQRADLVFYNGLHLEGKMVELLEAGGDRSTAVTRDIPESYLLGEPHAHDPHVWFDPTLWQKAAGTIADRLSKALPAKATEIPTRRDALIEKLARLHTENIAAFQALPKERRVLVTSHDAYNYFGRAYGVTVFGLQGISTETEAGVANVNDAVNFILRNKVPSIFVESSVSPKTIERVRDDCRAKGWNVTIGGELFSDALGMPGQHPGYAVETYEGMMRYNVATIVGAMK